MRLIDKKRSLVVIFLLVLLFVLAGCTQADKVTSNLRRQAEDFNIRRRITVFNTRTDTPLMQVTGLLSIGTDSDGDLNITIEKAPGEYVLNFAHLSQDTTYIVEQIETKEVSKYAYEIVFYPKQLASGWFDLRIEND